MMFRGRTAREWARFFSHWLVSRGLEAARWIEEESVFALEARCGAAVFGALFLFSLLRPVPEGLFDGTHAEAALRLMPPSFLRDAACHAAALLALLVIGAFLGAVVRNAWALAGLLAPPLERHRFPRRVRAAGACAAVLFLHLYFFAAGMAERPALYRELFYDAGGLFRLFHRLAVDCPPWLLGAWGLAAAAVFLAAAVEWLRRFRRWFLSFSLPARLGCLVLGGAAALAGLGVWSVSRVQALRNQGPNLLVIVVDGLRSDALSPEGPSKAPNLSDLARQGRAYTACVPPLADPLAALATFWTGRTPLTHGVRHSFPPDDPRLGAASLPAVLRAAGYRTAALTDAAGDFFKRTRAEFDEVSSSDYRFETVRRQRTLLTHPELLVYLARPFARARLAALRNMPALADPGDLAREAEDRLEKLRFRRKFCLAVEFSALTPPYAISSREAYETLNPRYAGPAKFALSRAAGGRPFGAVDQLRVRELYDANLRAVDAAVGRLLGALDRLRLAESTVVAVWSPFGAQLYERSRGVGHGHHLKGTEILSAPFIVLEPRRRSPPRWVDEPVRAHDAAPTLMDVLELGEPADTEGFSLKRRDFGGAPDEFFLTYSETGPWNFSPEEGFAPQRRLDYGPARDRLVAPPGAGRPVLPAGPEDAVLLGKHRMIQIGPERLIYMPTRAGVRYEYYDLAADPGTAANLALRKSSDERLQELKDAFFRYLSREKGWRPQNGYWIPEAILREDQP